MVKSVMQSGLAVVDTSSSVLSLVEKEGMRGFGSEKVWSWFPTGIETKTNCAGGGQQQITDLVKNLISNIHSSFCVEWSSLKY
jgi:hypothetical protein